MRNNRWDVLDLLFREDGDNFAVVVLNQPILAEAQFVSAVWNKAKIRVTVDGGSNRWLDFIKTNNLSLPEPDFITGDFDSIKSETEKYFKDKNVSFISTPDQDETDYTKSLREIKKYSTSQGKELRYVISLIETSGRLDQILANLETLYKSADILEDISLIQLSSDSLTWLLQPGLHSIQTCQEFVENGYWCGLIPLSGQTLVTTTGLKWNLSNDILEFGRLVSTSNTYSSDKVTVQTDKNLIWTMQVQPEK